MHGLAIFALLVTPDHIHPILVNFTAALVPFSVLSDVVGRVLQKPALHVAAWWALLCAAAITPLTALAGLWWKQSVADALPHSQLMTHQWLGIALAVLFIILAVWRWSIYRAAAAPGAAYLIFGLIVLAALIFQGDLGGKMLFPA